MHDFNPKLEILSNVHFLEEWFLKHSNDKGKAKAVIGISGGKDSTVAAELLIKAIGNANVIGVMMPNGEQYDIDDAKRVCGRVLNIPHMTINIENVYKAELKVLADSDIVRPTDQLITNLPPRIRMMTLYAVAQSLDVPAFVVNTCNRSEDYVGYSTRYGDAAGDIAVLQDYLVSEVIAIGEELGLPKELVHKTPSDGLCGKTDEENLGFSYAGLDTYLIGKDMLAAGLIPESTINRDLIEIIEKKHIANLHKLKRIPSLYNR